MSHVAVVACQVKDLTAMAEACERRDAEFMFNQKKFKAYGSRNCEHAIRLKNNPNAYEVGLTPRTDGQPGWNLAYDPGMSQSAPLHKAFGMNLVGLQNTYLEVVAENQLRQQGYMVQRQEEGERVVLTAFA